jgi:type VI secretion system protein ImpI
MGLTLTIENESSLPDGGPLSVRVTGKRGLDIGRDSHLDWTLPDPTRFISSKHCEVRYRDGGYWLHDVSTNGTFLNGSDGRMKAPHRLRNGDRLTIGHYIVAVALDGEEGAPQRDAAPATTAQATAYQDLWSGAEDAAPPIDPKLLRPPRSSAPVRPDFLDWAVDVPDTLHIESALPRSPQTAPHVAEDVWAQGPTRAEPAPEPPPATPAPRRPIWVSGEPSGPWGASPTPAEPAPEPRAPAEAAPPVAAPHAPPPPPAPAMSAASADFVRDLARGAGLPESYFAQDPQALAQQVGTLLRLVTENMQQLLNARGQSKRLARMSQQTTIEALNNNPLKFAPGPDEALRIMFGAPTQSYLDARRALQEAFADVKDHQVRTYAAMQQALAMIVADLDPAAIDAATEADRGISGMIGSRKARLWDAFVARWQAKTRGQDDGMVEVFMQYFAECYDRGVTTKR